MGRRADDVSAVRRGAAVAGVRRDRMHQFDSETILKKLDDVEAR
jgi:hypothetical protein